MVRLEFEMAVDCSEVDCHATLHRNQKRVECLEQASFVGVRYSEITCLILPKKGVVKVYTVAQPIASAVVHLHLTRDFSFP